MTTRPPTIEIIPRSIVIHSNKILLSIAKQQIIHIFEDGIIWDISLDRSKQSDTLISKFNRRPNNNYPLSLKESGAKRKKPKTTKLQNPDPETLQHNGRFIRSALPFIERIGPDMWMDKRTGDIIDADTVQLLYGDRLYGYIEDVNDG